MNFGQLDPFDQRKETFTEYIERLDLYFIANQIEDETRKRALFLTLVGASNYRLVRNLAAPRDVKSLSLDELCGLMKAHYEPKPQKYVQRTKFESRNRMATESINDYVASLRQLSEFCEFGTTLEDRLCERLVRGINDEKIQRRLLSETDLTFQKAVTIAQAVSTSETGARNLLQEQKSLHHLRHADSPRHKPKPSTAPTQSLSSKCQRCGNDHRGTQCKFINTKCYNCSKIGHLSKMCKSKSNRPPTALSTSATRPHQRGRKHRSFFVSEEDQPSPEEPHPEPGTSSFDVFQTETTNLPITKPVWVPLHIEGKELPFQLDTGASTTVIPKSVHQELFPDLTLTPSSVVLKTYTGQTVTVCGQVIVSVSYQSEHFDLPLLVVETTGPPLLGRNWLETIKLNWNSIFHTDTTDVTPGLQRIMAAYNNVFNDNAGQLRNHVQHIFLRENATPIFKKARHPPYALRPKIESELTRLVNNDIIEKVDYSDWATPIVPILKSDASLRICGDYKVTVNTVIAKEEHPIPRIEELANNLAHGQKFSTIDFSHAYTHLVLDPESQNVTTINTHCGLYRYKRLPYGISSCPAIFQRVMESVFKEIPNIVIYFDNLYLTGSNDKEHLETLEAVLKRCKERGLNIKRSKCEFMVDEIDFLGYRLTKEGISPQPKKVEAVLKAPAPSSLQELRAYLGMLNYYSKFLPNISHRLAPLYDLLKKDCVWKWTLKHQTAFEDSKRCLSSKNLLVHFDTNVPVILTCDASPRGVSAILSHSFDDGTERPIAYGSRSLDKAEQNYSQLDKEALSIIFGLRKFHKYIFGQHVTIRTDHKPLLGLFGENKPIPDHASSRVQRWAVILCAYDYKLEHVPGHRNNADALSRLPLYETAAPTPFPEDLHQVFQALDDLPVTSAHIAGETSKDPVLRQIYEIVAHGFPWPTNLDENFRPFFARKTELSVDNGCILWGIRVIIPTSLRQNVLALIHEDHIGIVRMKMLARSYVWWPKIDRDLELQAKSCASCQSFQNTPVQSPLYSWNWPTQPWSRIHIDFAGPFLGHMFLVIVDAHSKWIDIRTMKRITSSDTIFQLRAVFATHGLPDTIVSDNGPSFVSQEFEDFLRFNGIEHIKSTPYHPSTNGLAERAVATFKSAMKKIHHGSVLESVNRFLLKYRSTPQTTTGLTPAELLLGRKIKTRLDLVHDKVHKSVEKQIEKQKMSHDKHSQFRDFAIEDNVFVENHAKTNPTDPKFLPATILEKSGPLSYKAKLYENDQVKRFHADHIIPTHVDFKTSLSGMGEGKLDSSFPAEQPANDCLAVPDNIEKSHTPESEKVPEVPVLRRSQRNVKPPEKLNL